MSPGLTSHDTVVPSVIVSLSAVSTRSGMVNPPIHRERRIADHGSLGPYLAVVGEQLNRRINQIDNVLITDICSRVDGLRAEGAGTVRCYGFLILSKGPRSISCKVRIVSKSITWVF